MINNENIVNRIRYIAHQLGMKSDNAICKQCNLANRMAFRDIVAAKTAPRLSTLEKFATGLGVEIDDLIRDTTNADREIRKKISALSEYEKAKVVAYIDMITMEKNTNDQRKVA